MTVRNLLHPLPPPGPEEHIETLLARPGLKVERIVSHGHASPPGFWYEQTDDEWVMLVQGCAELLFECGENLPLRPGDWLQIPAGRRHRVASTDPDTVWLTIHVTPGDPTRFSRSF
ncbi:cupin domain-containing protein [Zoogloea sp.]|uniref:cupin domain-containing protein n=1 Tax=Zoogloea sp. TaxID=49181 RepID=UPI00262CA0DF|nr:cupin domain-containing protein [Zoogloea sp.]MDD3352243.1 cupin domain-containing protein [Zoogloea sp.]